MTRIFFGGSFDPIHRGHLAIADAVKKMVQPTDFFWIPAWISPHKIQTPPAAVQDRLALLQCALKPRENEVILDLEVRREGPSYTIETLRILQENPPKQEDYFVLGGDSLERIAQWRDIGEIMTRVTFLIAPRLHWGPESELGWRATLPEGLSAVFKGQWLPMEPVDLSSREIRDQVRLEKEIPEDFPNGVLSEIRRRCLYQS